MIGQALLAACARREVLRQMRAHFVDRGDQAIARVLARFDGQLAVGTPTACWVVSAMAFAAEMPMMDRPDDGEPRNLARLILHGIAAPITLEASC